MTYRNYIYKTYQDSAKKRNIPFELSFEEFNDITSKNCVYCGKEPEVPTCKRYLKSKIFTTDPDAKFNGVDRIDSTKGYTFDNCAPCCETCNKMKLDHSKEFFIKHITKIYNFNKSSTTIETASKDETE